MKVKLTFVETLVWHDVPQLFVAKDPIGGLHLCLAVDDSRPMLDYISVAISVERLQALKLGKLDLRTVFAKPELGLWSRITSFDDTHVTIEPMPGAIPVEHLPEPDAFLPRQALIQPESFEAVKISAVAKEAGMNPTLLRQYISGIKRPSIEQAKRVQDALHRVGQRLLEVRLI